MDTSTLPVVAPSDAEYATDVAGYNRIVTHRPRLVVGARTASGDAIAPAVHRWLEWTGALPETMNSSVLLMRLPDLPVIPEAVRGRRIAHVRIAHVGPPAEATALPAPLRAVGPVRDTVAVLPAGALGSIHDEPPGPVVFESRNSLLGPLDPRRWGGAARARRQRRVPRGTAPPRRRARPRRRPGRRRAAGRRVRAPHRERTARSSRS